jgi:hypothetical protein
VTEETKLRIHKIVAGAAVKFGSESWVPKERDKKTGSSTNKNFKTFIRNYQAGQGKKSIREGETWSAERCFGNKTVPTTVATERRKNGYRQATKNRHCSIGQRGREA